MQSIDHGPTLTGYTAPAQTITQAREAKLDRQLGDGSAVTLDQFKAMDAGQRSHLHTVNVDHYRALRDEELGK